MTKAKKRKIKKKLNKPKLPNNECFWLSISQNPEQILDFIERGNDLQRKNMKAVIDYRLWQIQEGKLAKDYFGDLDVKKLDFNAKPTKRKPRKVVKKVFKKPIDLFDMGNIEDLIT